MAAPTYRYKPLPSGRHIRVLRLRPALIKSQPLVCTLVPVAIDDYFGHSTQTNRHAQNRIEYGHILQERLRQREELRNGRDTKPAAKSSPSPPPPKTNPLTTNKRVPTPYEALSYTWGARAGTLPITCFDLSSDKNGGEGRRGVLLVTPNCDAALRHLRLRLRSRVLWIDAICIDQQSVREKNEQVPMMGDIYREAARCVVWLGTAVGSGPTGGTSPGFYAGAGVGGLAGQHLACGERDGRNRTRGKAAGGDDDGGDPDMTGVMRRARVAGRIVHMRASPGQDAVNEDGKKMARRWFSRREIVRVQRVCANDWFQRIWTMQEMLLAPTTVFMLGRTECPASALYTYVLIAESLMDSDTRERMQFRMRSIVLEEVAKNRPKSSTGWIAQTSVTSRWPVAEKYVAEINETLELLLHMGALNNATDPRDKVYGMLGMLKAFVPLEVHLPSVDYAKSLQDVYEEFAYHMMRTTGTLLPLEMILHASAEDLPSWVPDLRDASAVAWTPFRTGLKRYVRHNNEMHLPDEWQPGRLEVRARPLASVLEVFTRMPRFEVGTPPKYVDAQRTDCLSAWTAMAMDRDRQLNREEDDPEKDFCVQSLLRLTPFLDYLRERHEPPEPEEPEEPDATLGGTPAQRRKQKGKADKPKSSKDSFFVVNMYDGAALFLTECGLWGLCKGHVEPGDQVSQLMGGRVPFVLRSVGPAPASEFQLVGTTDVADLEGPGRQNAWQTHLVEDEYLGITLV